jgi:hypothetical protein
MTIAFPNVVFDYRVLAWIPVLVSESFVDALGCVTLLLRRGQILLQDLVDYALERVGLRSTWR